MLLLWILRFFWVCKEFDFGNFVYVLGYVFFLLIECDLVKFFNWIRLVIIFLLELFIDICGFFLFNEFCVILWMREELGDIVKFL